MKLVVVDLDGVSDRTLAAALSVLPPARQRELERLADPVAARSAFAEAAVRREIVRTLRIPNERIDLRRSANGKPFLAGIPFPFSLSHSDGCAVCATDSGPVGVDVERVRPVPSERIAARYFSPEERGLVRRDPTGKTFFRLWTAKESVIKQRGSRLYNDLRSLEIEPQTLLRGERLDCIVRSFETDGKSRIAPFGAGDGGNYVLSVCAQTLSAPMETECIAADRLADFFGA